MLIVSDVHGAFDDLGRVARQGETLLVLGDLLNLMDYRTGEGMTADVMGISFARDAARARGRGDYEEMRRLWRSRVGEDAAATRQAFDDAARVQYEAARSALDGSRGYVTYGNVDRPDMLAEHLPSGFQFVDGDVVEIEGVKIGFVGGGVSTPIGAAGEVSDEEMAEKLGRIGSVDVLCSHLPPAVPALYFDVVTGRPERASTPILEYLLDTRPSFHFFGDVHQPQASRWRVGATRCQNVGYFRATRRAVRFEPDAGS